MFGGIGDMSHEAEGQRDFAASFANGALIIDDEQVEKIGGHNLRGGDERTNGG